MVSQFGQYTNNTNGNVIASLTVTVRVFTIETLNERVNVIASTLCCMASACDNDQLDDD